AFIRVSIAKGHEAAHDELALVNKRARNGEEWSAWNLPVGWNVTCSRKLFEMSWDVVDLRPAAGGVALLVRGFVAEVACRCHVWFRHGPRLVRLAPLERVRLTDFLLDERDSLRGSPLNVEVEAALAEVSDRLGWRQLVARRKAVLAILSDVLIERAKRATSGGAP